MADLVKAFGGSSFTDVSTYLQTGNVLFESGETDRPAIEKEVEAALLALGVGAIDVIVRSRADLDRVVAANPFEGRPEEPKHLFVTFFKSPFDKSKLKGKDHVLEVLEEEAFTYCSMLKNRFDHPNMQALTKTPCTMRNWNVVQALAEKLKTGPRP